MDKIRWSVSKAMSCVFDALKKSKLRIKKTRAYSSAISRLCKLYGLSQVQVWILCMVCDRYVSRDDSFIMSNFSDVLEVSAMSIMTWKKEVELLIEKGFFEWNRRDNDFQPANDYMASLYENTGFAAKERREVDEMDFLTCFAERYESRRGEDISAWKIQRELFKYEDEHQKLKMIQRVRGEIEERNSRFFLYDVAHDVMKGGNSNLNATICDLYDGSERYSVASRMMDESHVLFKKGLLEFTKKGNLTDAYITLTDKAKKLVFADKAFLFEDALDDKLLIKAETIKEKRLFYSQQNQKEIDRLKNALQDETLTKIQERLGEQGLPTGVAVLLYGAPGTGKTESVLQIARETGRHVVHVDISETKSAWFGESEKQVKKIFTSYKNACVACKKKGEKIPILLFNEADAIISKRKDSNKPFNRIKGLHLERQAFLAGRKPGQNLCL